MFLLVLGGYQKLLVLVGSIFHKIITKDLGFTFYFIFKIMHQNKVSIFLKIGSFFTILIFINLKMVSYHLRFSQTGYYQFVAVQTDSLILTFQSFQPNTSFHIVPNFDLLSIQYLESLTCIMGFYLTQVPIFLIFFFELVLTIRLSIMVSFKGYLGYFQYQFYQCCENAWLVACLGAIPVLCTWNLIGSRFQLWNWVAIGIRVRLGLKNRVKN